MIKVNNFWAIKNSLKMKILKTQFSHITSLYLVYKINLNLRRSLK